MLFVTSYSIIGSRCTGSYLVNAENKRSANKIVKAIDIDYCRISSLSEHEIRSQDGDEYWETCCIDMGVPEMGKYIQLECGT